MDSLMTNFGKRNVILDYTGLDQNIQKSCLDGRRADLSAQLFSELYTVK